MVLTKKILNLRPKKIQEKFGQLPILLLDSHTVFKILGKYPLVILAANPRIKHVIPGLIKAAEEMDSVIIFQIAKSEGDLKDGYTGFNPETFFETIIDYALKNKFSKPFVINLDHLKVEDDKKNTLKKAKDFILKVIEIGYTSIAIDASSFPLKENIKIVAELAQPVIKNKIGLEVELGEVLPKLDISKIPTKEEAEEFIKGLIKLKIKPDLLAIYNGAKHGNYLPNEKVFIDLKRTREIYQVVKKYGISIVQHGITGTPLKLMKKFVSAGIRKGNVATEWQNIVIENLPISLRKKIEDWAVKNNKDIKYALKEFKFEIDNLSSKYVEKIILSVYKRAKELISIFQAKNSASKLLKELKSGLGATFN
jgi:fructose-bisphosphate aldolase class II